MTSAIEPREPKRGSRTWFYVTLKQIEACGGEAARDLAVKRWWESNHDVCELESFAEMLPHQVRLERTVKRLNDRAASSKISKILKDGDRGEIIRVSGLLSDDRIQKATHAQGRNEDRIRELAKIYGRMGYGGEELAWRRRLRQETKQAVSYINLTLGLVGVDAANHCTPYEKQLRDEQKARWTAFGESVELQRDGQKFKLIDAMSKAGKRRASEIYALSKGLEKYAAAAGKTWAFLTLTAPAHMHPNPSAGKNTWDGTTPDQAHKWIKDARERAEARCRKAKIIISGVRVVEPHKDGCPHEHLLVFADPTEMATIEAKFREKQPEWKSEAGMKFVLSDGRASAASYLFKYVLKTVSSVEALAGERGTVDAWRSTWGIRAFSSFGMPPMGLWRNLRALKDCPTEPKLAGLWRAVHRGDGQAFIGLAGGLNVKTKDRPVISRKEKTDPYDENKKISFVINETGEVHTTIIKKWTRQNTPKPSSGAVVGVIPNYPRKPSHPLSENTKSRAARGENTFQPHPQHPGGCTRMPFEKFVQGRMSGATDLRSNGIWKHDPGRSRPGHGGDGIGLSRGS